MDAKTQMKRYKSHKEVEAFKITEIIPVDGVDTFRLGGDDCSVMVLAEYARKHKPEVGGYYVRYADGYESYSPGKAFEDGYFPMDRVGELSDGYHTFDELYFHRMCLFAYVVCQNRHRAWKSRQHHDGTMFERYFIVGMRTRGGMVSYHYELRHWDLFKCEELDRAPEFDGHTSDDVCQRLLADIELWEEPLVPDC